MASARWCRAPRCGAPARSPAKSRSATRGVRAVGYLQATVPPDVEVDAERYAVIRRTAGEDFSVEEPLRYWADIMAAGVAADVRVLAIGGGRISEAEYRMALAFGARVGADEERQRRRRVRVVARIAVGLHIAPDRSTPTLPRSRGSLPSTSSICGRARSRGVTGPFHFGLEVRGAGIRGLIAGRDQSPIVMDSRSASTSGPKRSNGLDPGA